MQVDLQDIRIPERRMRALGDISALAESMNEIGQIEPVVLTMSYRLVAGAHRVSAAKQLGWKSIEAVRLELDDLQAELAEIDENLIRNELTALERAEHLARRKELYEALHPATKHGGNRKSSQIKSDLKPEKFTTNTAKATGVSRSVIEQHVQIANAIPEAVKQHLRGTAVEDRKTDLMKLARMDAPEQKQVAEKIAAGAKTVKEAKKQLHREAKTPSTEDSSEAAKNWHLIHSDCRSLAIADASVDCIITDPPYPREYLQCFSDLSETASRVLKPGGACIVMSGQSYLPEVIERLAEHLTYHWTVAYLTPGGQAVQLWDRKVNTFWKPLLWFVKPPAGESDWQGDVVGSATNDNDKRFHDWGQSESGMASIVDRFTYPGQTILDPFVGGGATGVASVKLGRLFIGSDVDEKQLALSRERLTECV